MSFKYKNKFISKIAVLIIIISTILGEFTFSSDLYNNNAYEASVERQYLPSGKLDVFQYLEQTPVSGILNDENGLPYQVLENGSIIRNPSNIASLLFLDDGIKNDMGAAILGKDNIVDKEQFSLTEKQKAAFDYCRNNLSEVKYNNIKADILIYDFEYIYNEHVIKPPFGSAIAQYAWIRALSRLYDYTNNKEYFDMLIRAMNAFRVPIEYGGLMYRFDDGDIWFEEMPVPKPTHILNGHLAAASEIYNVAQKYGLHEFLNLAIDGFRSAEKRLDTYDLDNWSRYDMAWKLYENQFKVEFVPDIQGVDDSQAFAISNIETYRNNEGKRFAFSVDDIDAFQGSLRLAGMGWSNVDNIGGESGRWVIPSKYIYADYGRKFWENDIQSLMFLGFPDSNQPYEKQGDFGLKLKYYAKYPGKLTISLRDNSHSEDYKYSKNISFQISNTNSWNEIQFTINKKFFSEYINTDYHTRSIEALYKSADAYNNEEFKKMAQKFSDYYTNDYGDFPPINIRGINTLWGYTENLNKDKSIKIEDLTGAFEKDEKYKVENLIDGSKNSYTATLHDVEEAIISLKLKDRAVIDSIKIIPYSKDIYFSAYVVKVFNKGQLIFKDDITTSKYAFDKNEFIFYRFNNIIEGDEIQITFSNHIGQERFVLNELMLYGSYDRAIGRELIEDLLKDAKDDLSKVIRIGSFVADYFEPGVPVNKGLRSILKQKLSACGINSNIARYLLAEAGIQSRFINLYNIPQVIGHSLIEVYVSNKWVYYDPTYAYFVAVPRSVMYEYSNFLEDKYRKSKNSCILASLDELSAHPEWVEKYAMHYDFESWTAEERRKTLGNANLPLFPLGQYTSPNTIAMANPKGPTGKDYVTSFPIYVTNGGAEYGEVDNSIEDIRKIGIPSGISYIGLASWNVMWDFLFDNTRNVSKKWRIEIYPQMVSSDKFLLTMKLNNCSSVGKKEFEIKPLELNGRPIVFEIERQKEDNFSIEVYHNEQGYMNVDAIKVIPINTLNN